MYYGHQEYQCRSDDGGSHQCNEFADALGCNKEELGSEEADSPQVTGPWEAERDRQGKKPEGA